MNHDVQKAQSLSRIKKISARTGLSRSCIYERMAKGTFPRNISLGAKAVAWLDTDIDDWIQDRINQSQNVVRVPVKSQASNQSVDMEVRHEAA